MAVAPDEGALGSDAFGRFYFLTDYGEVYERNDRWLSFFSTVAARLVDLLAPSTVLDAGCALGLLVETLVRHGVDARGIDISEWAIANAHSSIADRVSVGSLLDPLPGRYDLVTCLEVLEHLPPDDGERAIANICAVTDRVVFSSTPSHFSDTTHLNVQPIEWWAERFATHGFLRNPDLHVGFIVPWAVVFERAPGSRREVVRRYERELGRLRIERNEVRTALLLARQRLDAIMAAAASVGDEAGTEPEEVLRRLGADVVAQREEADRIEEALRDEVKRLQAERDRYASGAPVREQLLADAVARAEIMERQLAQHSAAAQRREELLADSIRRVDGLESALEAQVAQAAQLEADLSAAVSRLEELEEERTHLLAAVAHRDELLRSASWRVGRALVGPAARLRRALGGSAEG